MAAAILIPIIGKIIDKVITDKDQNAAAKQQLAVLAAQGDLQQTLAETQGQTTVLQAEAQSQSWLPRNVRPLLLLLWGSIITLNFAVPIVARFWIPNFQPLVIDPWVFKLTAIGYTGYVGFRSWEKVNASN